MMRTSEKIAVTWLIAIAVSMVIAFVFLKQFGGDIGNVTWRLSLTRIHLSNELSIPYFTPAHCGGFHLAADAQDFLFSIYTPISFFIHNSNWSMKFTNVLLTFFLMLGIYFWLPFFGAGNKIARIFAGIFVGVSGYWICHMVRGGHAWAHGLAYVPWIMILLEQIFSSSKEFNRSLLLKCLLLSGLFFLLINSGYYWFQFAVPVILIRVLIEFFGPLKGLDQRIIKVCLVGFVFFFAMLLSAPRIGGIY
jgi:hypothetical protein